MSISYYALPIRDKSAIGPILEGEYEGPQIDVAAIRAKVTAVRGFSGGTTGTIKWEVGGDYIFVDVSRSHVAVTHNSGRGSLQIEVLIDLLDRLKRSGLYVYDPQRGDWFPG
jgi:hypothetical protein